MIIIRNDDPSTRYMTLRDLPADTPALVTQVRDLSEGDIISQRLRELGFVPGEPVEVIGRGPLGGEPLLIRVGFTRFALRHGEAERVLVERAA